MSTYVHKCPQKGCRATCEVQYSMAYVGDEQNLPNSVRQQVTCNRSTCKHAKIRRRPSHALWPRVPQVPQLKGSAGGQTLTEKQLVARDKPKRRLRSRLHFKNDVLPTLSKRDQTRFGRKWAHIKGDHEKIKI